jgi:hypothetical protein
MHSSAKPISTKKMWDGFQSAHSKTLSCSFRLTTSSKRSNVPIEFWDMMEEIMECGPRTLAQRSRSCRFPYPPPPFRPAGGIPALQMSSVSLPRSCCPLHRPSLAMMYGSLNCTVSLDFDHVVSRANPAPGGRVNPAGQRHRPRSLSVSQPLPLLHVLIQFLAFGKSAIGSSYGIETGEAAKKPVVASSFFSRVAVLNPSPTLPRRKLTLLRSRRLHNVLRDVGVARPSSSRRQHPCRFAPLLLRFSRKIRPFWLGPARQSTAGAAGPSPRL